MCQHESECESILNANTLEQDIQCLCKPGYTGKYCQYSTTFRMDATYSVAYEPQQQPSRSNFSLKFDFRVHFFNRFRMPLVYLKDETNSLVVAVELTRMSIRVSNPNENLNQHLGFFYDDDDDDDNTTQTTSSETGNMWSTLEIESSDPRTLKFIYSVKQLHLSVSKVITLSTRNRTLGAPSKFVLGKSYAMDSATDADVIRAGVYSNEPYFLNSACIRDFTLNGEQLFKSEAADYVNSGIMKNNSSSEEKDQLVKFGCNLYQELPGNQCNTELVTNNKNVCQHNSSCVNKWFDYECANCSWPFFGKNCQYGSFN